MAPPGWLSHTDILATRTSGHGVTLPRFGRTGKPMTAGSVFRRITDRFNLRVLSKPIANTLSYIGVTHVIEDPYSGGERRKNLRQRLAGRRAVIGEAPAGRRALRQSRKRRRLGTPQTFRAPRLAQRSPIRSRVDVGG
jgi:hypothetical protein